MFLELCSHTSQNRHGCRFRSNAYKDVCLLRWRTYRKPISEFLEHLASYNGADMHKYNTLYTRKLSWHVLTPTSSHTFIVIYISELTAYHLMCVLLFTCTSQHNTSGNRRLSRSSSSPHARNTT